MKGKKLCGATCSHFRCGQRALYVKKAPQQQGGPQGGYQGGYRSNSWQQRPAGEGTAYCNWVGDVCVVAGCNYAFCERRALLPDGSCGLDEKEGIRQVKTIEDEAKREELLVSTANEKLLKKKGLNFIE
jgi:hypothetical protein